MLERRPEEVIRKAVKGMLPRNRLARQQLTKLKVYAGPDHPHAAQQPKPMETDELMADDENKTSDETHRGPDAQPRVLPPRRTLAEQAAGEEPAGRRRGGCARGRRGTRRRGRR